MRSGNLTTYVWLGGIALQLALAAILVGRRVWRTFPIFSGYFLSNLAMNCLLYLVVMVLHVPRAASFYFYWSAQCIVLTLGLGVVFEVFTQLFAPYAALKKTAETVFRCSALILAICGAIVIFVQPHGQSGQQNTFFVVVQEVVRLVEVALVAFLFLSAGLFGLHWRQSGFGIALGMGSYAIVDLVTVSLRAYFGSEHALALNMAIMIAFDISVLIWMGYVRVPQPAMSAVDVAVPEHGQLEQWNKALTELIYQ